MSPSLIGGLGRRPSAIERYFQGRELTDADLDFILKNAPHGFWETFAFEELPRTQQVYAAEEAPDEAIDYFLDGDGICEEAQRVLASRDVAHARLRLASKADLADDLHQEFVRDKDDRVRCAMANRADLTDSELTDLVCDSDWPVAVIAMGHCKIYSTSELGQYLLSSENEYIRASAQATVLAPPSNLEMEFGINRKRSQRRTLESLPDRLRVDVEGPEL